MNLTGLLRRALGRDGRAEADVIGDAARADSRDTGGDPDSSEAGTTATGPAGDFVGRIAGDEDFSGETGAERRAGPPRPDDDRDGRRGS